MLMRILVCAVAFLVVMPVGAQAQSWRTPWGDPDLQGSWSNATTTPLERPAKYAGREFLTKQEQAAQNTVTAVATDKRDERGTPDDVNGAYNGFWWERGWSDGRTSLIYDPPDGRIPAMTSEGKKRQGQARRSQNEAYRGAGPYNGPEDLELYTRCVVRAALPRVPTGYDNNYEIVQTPGSVAILQEQIHETRIIALDGRPHLDSGVRQWFGDSRGHWEGDTLVVETTNFGEKSPFHGSDENLKLIEKFTRTGPDTILYEFTVDDSTAFTKSFSGQVPMNKAQGPIIEYACHEGNYAMTGMLA